MPDAPEQPLVLYVDDEAANRIVFLRTFEESFRVEAVASGEEALQRVAQETPAVVVADQRMPGMQGTELLALLRERSPETVRVILTAYADPGPMLEAINRAGASRYIMKPWAAAEMQAVLQGAVESFLLQGRVRRLQLQLVEANPFVALGMLSATVAHDMSSPLSALVANMERVGTHAVTVKGLAERAERAGVELGEPERDAVQELPEIARESQESVSYLSTLVGGIRGHARAGSGEPAEPQQILAFVVPLVRGLVVERGGRIEVECPESPPLAVPGTELSQILVNLATNAAQALTRERRERRLTLRVCPEGELVRFEVQDTGSGMTAEQVARAGRERFTTKPQGQGTGLGLTIVRQLVERNGGRLELQSQLGVGTLVQVWLPAAKG